MKKANKKISRIFSFQSFHWICWKSVHKSGQ